MNFSTVTIHEHNCSTTVDFDRKPAIYFFTFGCTAFERLQPLSQLVLSLAWANSAPAADLVARERSTGVQGIGCGQFGVLINRRLT